MWRRLGRVFAPTGAHPALLTHAALPVAVPVGGDLVRVFYSGRDAANRSSLGSFVLRLGDAPRVEEADPAPLLTPGATGAFDDAGIGLGCVVPCADGPDRLYYMGWNIGGSVPWRNAIGLALGDARTGRFERHAIGPIMDRDPLDPFSLSYPWVLRLGPRDWRMWYGTHLAWGADKTDMHHAIRGARSADGIRWERDPAIALGPAGADIAVVRPCVLPRAAGAEMWFAARATDGPYRLGHATSPDLATWTRDEAALLHAEPEGFEAGALTYASVFEAVGRRWMLYNGAGYGRDGIGLAS
ncbi:MAG: hypothetical protein K2X74_21335 [Acetobacteraceae bacterium]|nr:hypothetical protein [Acetobacteraceae bacterium]